MIKNNYKATIFAACVGYTVQAVVVNFAPLLFLTFRESYGIPLSSLTVLITVNFVVQFLTDLLSPRFVLRIGYRKGAVLAHLFSAAGLMMMAFLPQVMDPFAGLFVSVCVYAVGGGLLEVLISPIVEACPTQNKAGFMSLLHSFYCWGVVFCVGLSTLFFHFVGTDKWALLSFLWALLPLLNIFLFLRVPLYPIEGEENGQKPRYRDLFGKKIFWLMMLFMLCAGAAELAVAQWASAFTESALGVSKTVGDLVGVCGFAVTMAAARMIYAKFDQKIPVKLAMCFCAALCVGGYLMIGLWENAVAGLIGCGICGFAVGIFWPASLSMATARIRGGGTLLFALLAVCGDLGCTFGPTAAGFISGAFGDNLRVGILSAIVFPLLILGGLVLLRFYDAGERSK